MITPLKRGDSIRDPRTINDLIKASNRMTSQIGTPFPNVVQSGNRLLVLNRTGHDLNPGECFPFYSGDAMPFPDNPERLFAGTVAIADIPNPEPDTVEWGIAGEAIADGMAGAGYDSGILLARVLYEPSVTDLNLNIDLTGDWWFAKRGTEGPARILWADTTSYSDGSGGSSWVWALIRLGAGSGGSATLLVVRATADGSAGVIPAKTMTLKADPSLSPNYDLSTDPTNYNYFKA